jgi:hypothetical protein
MRNLLIGSMLVLASAATAGARDLVYEGTWVTTNRPLDGTLKCVVTDLGNNQWRGEFSGYWGRQYFTYTVKFSGSPEKLRGQAVIDGADYDWTGEMSTGPSGTFKGKFGGNRYFGSFSMKQKAK